MPLAQKPQLVEPWAAITPLYGSFTAWSCPPLCVTIAFQALLNVAPFNATTVAHALLEFAVALVTVTFAQ